MKRTALNSLVGLIFVLAWLPVQADINASFEVKMKSSFGTIFMECLHFDDPGSGDLTIDGLGQTLTYAHGKQDSVHGTGQIRFKSVTRGKDDFEISFFGKIMKPGNRIFGEAVAEDGNSYNFTGKRKKCALPIRKDGFEASP